MTHAAAAEFERRLEAIGEGSACEALEAALVAFIEDLDAEWVRRHEAFAEVTDHGEREGAFL
ncbi:MAG: hypothetical protein AAGC67_00190 [Myxococcota bacterium]